MEETHESFSSSQVTKEALNQMKGSLKVEQVDSQNGRGASCYRDGTVLNNKILNKINWFN